MVEVGGAPTVSFGYEYSNIGFQPNEDEKQHGHGGFAEGAVVFNNPLGWGRARWVR